MGALLWAARKGRYCNQQVKQERYCVQPIYEGWTGLINQLCKMVPENVQGSKGDQHETDHVTINMMIAL